MGADRQARRGAALTLAILLSVAGCQQDGQRSAAAEGPASGTPATSKASPTSEAPTTPESPRAEDTNVEPIYESWERLLETYVDEEGLVDYEGIAGPGRSDLEAFMRTLASTDPAAFSEAGQIAFWINAYNALVIYQVVERYPLDSVRDVGALFGLVGGFFKQEYRIANEDRTLDNIEHDILRPTYNDARIHWTLVCGAFGCPRLLRRPYIGEDLDPLLTELSIEFLASPRALQVDDATTTLYLSSYFDWYGGDFEAEAGEVVDYVLRYATPDEAAWIREHRGEMSVRFMDYDWTLNDQSKGPRSRRPVDPTGD